MIAMHTLVIPESIRSFAKGISRSAFWPFHDEYCIVASLFTLWSFYFSVM